MILRASFDDSGTHKGSDIVIWGGVVGEIEHFAILEAAWERFLASPVEDGRRIIKWSSYDCHWGLGEFMGWEQGAKDRARRNARQCIIDSGVVPVSFAVPLVPWNRIMTGKVGQAFHSANAVAFSEAAKSGLKIAEVRKQAIAAVFDKGQQSPHFDEILRRYGDEAKKRKIPVSLTYQRVIDNYGLQAADVVATETYWIAGPLLRLGKIEMDPQQRAFFNGLEPLSLLMPEQAIRDLRERYLADHPEEAD
ncbi:MAG: hypothetical protein EBR34_12235 [Sphingomonadaceae bacterium]|nr:hypothetical protein [Sphingomonadaceae bacterium]